MKRYFRHEAESDLGEGIAYLEFDGQWVSRQLEIYEDGVFRGTASDSPDMMTDQPLEELGLTEEHEISAEEFNEAWHQHLT
ncbi:hypothetical protein ACU635_49865 [[Actinomadura] parvosata]|uniref:Myosin VI cargo binding domain-containing protein n=1 Tax=Nonomuraea composti TaxID=2720023 RepID=A0ABX1AWI2_9ACTN|nr:hypothetical protein [Nonomuraea sp. FMUSA5-5]NJP89978.1 hypothetical protein [Nonomuraea sp. FMUSA5-5]